MSPKQQKFVDEYLIDLNATQAAVRAGYSPETAYSQGQRLLKNVEVAAATAKAVAARSERTQVDADWLLVRLAEEAKADVADLYDDKGHLLAVKDWPLIWRQGLVAGIETLREKVGEDENGDPEFATVQKIKLSDRIKRLELIGRHVDIQAFQDRVKVDVVDSFAELEAARLRARRDRPSLQ